MWALLLERLEGACRGAYDLIVYTYMDFSKNTFKVERMESRVTCSGQYESKKELHRKQGENQCHAERDWRGMQ